MRLFQFIVVAALAVLACLCLAVPASANWGRWGYGGGYYGGYGYGYYPRYYGSYYPGYYGYSRGYYPAYGYGWNSYYPAYVPSYYAPIQYSYATPAAYVDPSVARSSTSTTSRSAYYAPPAEDNTARVRVLVPADAKVWVDDYATSQAGDRREFTTPALDPNKDYAYEVKARWMKAGSPVEQTRRVKVRANQTTTVDFGLVPERDK